MSKALYGAEILDVGTWPASTGTVTVPSSAIDALVASFEALGLSRKVPLKAGHNHEQPMTNGQPALGWVSRVWREGNKLLADFVDMPDVVHAAIKNKLYKTVSVELLRDVQAGTRKLPWVLDAVALLGADQPAVGTLKDLEALTMTRKPVMQARARVAFMRQIHFSTMEAKKAMTDEEKAEINALKTSFSSQIEALSVKLQKSEERAEAAEKARATAEIARHRDLIKAKFETAIKAEAIKPAVREEFYKLTRIDTDAVLDIKPEDADSFINDRADKAKLSAKPTSQQGQPDADEVGKSAAEVVVLRARKLCFERKLDPNKFEHINSATIEVLTADKALGEAYKVLGDAPTKAA